MSSLGQDQEEQTQVLVSLKSVKQSYRLMMAAMIYSEEDQLVKTTAQTHS